MPTSLDPLTKLTARAVLDPLWFLKRWTPAAVPSRYAPYHQALVNLPEPGQAQMRSVFRGAAKTTVVRGLVLHSAIHDHVPVRGILLIRATYGDAKADRKALARNAQLAGHLVHEDGETNMVVINNTPIWTRTPGGAVRGIQWTNPDTGEVVRPDLCVIDDLETRLSARSAQQTENIREWLFSDALATGSQDRPLRTIMLGTPITPNCLIAQAMRQSPPFDSWLPPLVVPIVDENGQPAWPDNWDPTIESRVPELTWATEYMIDPVPAGTLLFPPARTIWRDLPASSVYRLVIAVDPAGDGEDATAAVAMTLTPRGLHIVDVLQWTGPADNTPDQIAGFVTRLQKAGWTIAGLSVEGVGGWVFLKREIARAVAPVRVTSDVPKQGKVERALPLTVWHKAGALSVATHLKGSGWDVEFHSFTHDGATITGHDDCTDATAWAGAPLTQGWRTQPPNQVDALT